MNILFLYADTDRELNTSEWRCIHPTNAINKYSELHRDQGAKGDLPAARAIAFSSLASKDTDSLESLTWADIIVMERLIISNVIPYVLEATANGKVVIGDVDDAYHVMPKSVPSYQFWHVGKFVALDEKGEEQEATMANLPVEQLVWGLKLVHAVSSPSEKLLQYWERFGVRTIHIPNYIRAPIYLKHTRDLTVKKRVITIGWGGTISHYDSWRNSEIIPALTAICRHYSEVHICLAGGDVWIPSEINMPGRVTLVNWTESDEWPKTLARFDIGLVPLAGEYDQYRSWLKTLEYTLMGIPWVGSIGDPTRFFSAYGLCTSNKQKAWIGAIEKVISNYDAALVKVQAGRQLAINQDLLINVPTLIRKYLAVYNDVVPAFRKQQYPYNLEIEATLRSELETKYGIA